MTAEPVCSPILAGVNPRDRLVSAGKRWTDPAEALAQQVTERVVDLVVGALDVNEIIAKVDVNAIIDRGIRYLLRRKDPEPPPLPPVPKPPPLPPVEAEPVQAEPVQAEPVQAEPVQAEPVQGEPVQAGP